MYAELGSIRAYPVLYLLAIVVHGVVALLIARRLKLPLRWYFTLSASYAISMIVGARLLFDLTHGAPVSVQDLLTPAFYMRGGLWGGPLVHLAIVAAVVVALAGGRRGSRADVFDLAALSLPAPMMLAKIGCLMNGCCYGSPTELPWGLAFPENPGGAPAGVPLHPVQLYEIGVLAAAMVVLAALSGARWRGLRLPTFLMIYGVGRAAIEFLRGDTAERLTIGPLTVSQCVLFGVAAAAAVLVAVAIGRQRRSASLAG